MRKICIINNLANFYRCQFFNELSKDYDITVIFTKRQEEEPHRQASFFFNLDDSKFTYYFASGFTLGKWKLALRTPPVLTRKFDGIIIGLLDDPIALLCAEKLVRMKIPYLLSFDGVGRRNKVIDGLFARYIRSSVACLSPNRETDRYISELSGGSSIERYHFSSFTAEMVDDSLTPSTEKSKIRRSYRLDESRPLILGVGQVVERKGFDVLIESLKYIDQDTTVLIVGGESDELKESAAALAPRHVLRFIADAKQKELANVYRMADVFVLPTRGDSWGLVVPEAMSHGLPVVTTTKCGSGLELIREGENGFLVPPDDPYSLSRAINALLSDTQKRNTMGSNNLEKIRSGWTIEEMARSTSTAIGKYL